MAEQIRGVSYKKEEASTSPKPGNLPLLRAGNITDEGLIFDDLVFVPAERISKKQKVCRYDVVITASSGSLDIVGKAAPMLTDFDCGFGAFCKVLRPNSKVHPGYFAHFFKTKDYRQRISALAAGANINNLRNEHLDEMQIPLPPLDEQKRIADILDRAEALRAKRRAALAQLDELTQSIFVEMFGDPTRNPKNWDEKSLGNLCSYIIDCPHSTPKYEECITPYPCIRTTELKNGYIDWSEMKYISEEGYKERTKRLIPAEGDVVYGREGSFGEAIRIPKNTNICLGQRVMLFRPNHNLCNSVFLWALVRSNEIYQQALKKTNGSTVGHVNVNDIKKFTCFCPPLLLQDEFSAIIKSIEILKEKQQQSLLELNNLFDSLSYEAFTGKLFSHQFFEQEIENGVKI
ncbi:MAG TPA: restriction endonuclease subunit S [Methanosarcina vacuolata]|nr:restriction endonuclease subunit S [Methanosarcina vacuolata]